MGDVGSTIGTKLRALISRIPTPAVWLAAAVAFTLVAPNGLRFSSSGGRGWAEPLAYSIAPAMVGTIKEIRVTLGQPVKAGDVVAVLESRSGAADLEQLKAQLDGAIATVEAERANIQSGQLKEVQVLASEQQDRALLKELEIQLARLKGLAAKQLITASDMEKARREYTAVAARVATYERARKPGAAAANKTDPAAARLAPFQRAVEVRRAALAEAQAGYDSLTLRAPADGTVALVSKRPGEVVAAGVEVVSVVAARSGHVVAFMGERSSHDVRLGLQASLTRDADRTTHNGTVVELSPQLEQVPSRLWLTPSTPAWGRRLVIRLDQQVELVPGEAFDVSF
jgi:multidrug resistance efflux pump